MSLIRSKDERESLAAIFASRVSLAKKTIEQAMAEAIVDYHNTVAWIKSSKDAYGSFLWFCDEFELDPGTVRKAIKEKKA